MTVIDLNRGDALALQRERKPRFVLYRELEAESRKEWLVKDLLGAGDASAFYGVPGCGKSVLVEDMALHIAADREWHGRQVKPGAVLYVALERKKLVERRAIAFREKHGITDLPFAVLGGMYNLREPGAVVAIAAAAKQIEDIFGKPIVFLTIDTISRALCGGDENSPKDMGAIVAATSRLQEDTKAHISWTHHMPQDGAEKLRGHGALLGAMDTTIHVEKLSDDARTATVMKANDSEEGQRVTFALETVPIGPDTTAPVVVAASAASHDAPPRQSKLSKNQQTMLSLLRAAIPDGLTTDDWNELAREHGIGAKRRADLVDIRLALESKGLIHQSSDRWHVSV